MAVGALLSVSQTCFSLPSCLGQGLVRKGIHPALINNQIFHASLFIVTNSAEGNR